jgi:zinc transport system ATP-binding protein
MTVPVLVRSRNLTVRAGGRTILDAVSLEVNEGEILTVIGPNGAGKSTLLKALIGAIPPSSGEVWRAPALVIGYTPQRLAIPRSMPLPVWRFLGLDRGEAAGEIERVTGTALLLSADLAALSGGELQRVLLARALRRSPGLLVLDEPAQGLDQPGESRFYDLLAELRAERGIAVLMVSHDLHMVMAGSDRVICLNTHVCCSGAPDAVATDPAYCTMFGARAALAPYRHHHDHSHESPHPHSDATDHVHHHHG